MVAALAVSALLILVVAATRLVHRFEARQSVGAWSRFRRQAAPETDGSGT
ncbi:hypothetical protein ACIHIX_10485 [Streptomyces sp. NPDC051913]